MLGENLFCISFYQGSTWKKPVRDRKTAETIAEFHFRKGQNEQSHYKSVAWLENSGSQALWL